MSSREHILVVDRIEKRRVLMVNDDESTFEIMTRDLPIEVEEGSVLRVTFGNGRPLWGSARLDPEERQRRLEESGRKMDELRKSDPGGDLQL